MTNKEVAERKKELMQRGYPVEFERMGKGMGGKGKGKGEVLMRPAGKGNGKGGGHVLKRPASEDMEGEGKGRRVRSGRVVQQHGLHNVKLSAYDGARFKKMMDHDHEHDEVPPEIKAEWAALSELMGGQPWRTMPWSFSDGLGSRTRHGATSASTRKQQCAHQCVQYHAQGDVLEAHARDTRRRRAIPRDPSATRRSTLPLTPRIRATACPSCRSM